MVLVRVLAVLTAVCLVAVGAVAASRAGLPVRLPRSAGHALTAAPAAASVRPARAAASPTPDDLLTRARAIVAPAPPPTRLIVPAIGVDAAVEPVGLDGQGRMATPSSADRVAWYRPGATPGDAGDAVLAGHLDWTSGPAVFWYLGRLRPGDALTVARGDGSTARFVVDATTTMPFDAPTDSLFTKTGPPALTLITCAGSWDRQRATYLQRLVVRASLAASAPVDVPGDEAG